MKLYEDDVKDAQFDCIQTRINAQGEMDIYRCDEIKDLEIRVNLTADQKGLLVASSIHVLTFEGRPVKVYDEDGQQLDRQMLEIMAWDVVGYCQNSENYSSGRQPARGQDGARIQAGAVIDHASSADTEDAEALALA